MFVIRLIEAIGFYGFCAVVIGCFISLHIEGRRNLRRSRPYDWARDGD